MSMTDLRAWARNRDAEAKAFRDDTLFKLGTMGSYSEIAEQKENLPEAYFNAMYGHVFANERIVEDVYIVFKELLEGMKSELPRTQLMRRLYFYRMNLKKNPFHRKYSRMVHDIIHQFTTTQEFFKHSEETALKKDADLDILKVYAWQEKDLYQKEDEFINAIDELGRGVVQPGGSLSWRFSGAFAGISAGLMFTPPIGSEIYTPHWSTDIEPYLTLLQKIRPEFHR